MSESPVLDHPPTHTEWDAFESQVTEFTLDNGMKFIVYERHEVPIIAFHTYANVGSADEVKGVTGIAHLFEHMAFKGTTSVGTTDLEQELYAMDREDALFEKLRDARGERFPDAEKIAALEKELATAVEEARRFVLANELDRLLKGAGGVGLNASTSTDATRYYLALPSNKLELWFYLESDRFLNPVLREFHLERKVVMEERRQRVDNSPLGALLEEFRAAAFKAHPYGEPIIGHMADIEALSRAEALEFFRKHYVPSNLTCALVGDLDPAEARRLAEQYFGRLPAAPPPPRPRTTEPPQMAERVVIRHDVSQPIYIVGYHKGDINDPDWPVFRIIWDIIGRGRGSRLYRKLVMELQVATDLGVHISYPGDKYPCLVIIYAFSAKGHTAQACHEAIAEELERFKTELVSQAEMDKAHIRARADVIHGLESHDGLAEQLATLDALTGDWRNIFRLLDKIQAVTAEDVQRVAQTVFQVKNRTVGYIQTEVPPATAIPNSTPDPED
jgi:predicted Zn-dependent peptidase